MNYAYGSTRTFQVKVLESCGLAPRYSYSMGSGSCSGSSISNSYMTTNYGGTAGRSLKAIDRLSPSAATISKQRHRLEDRQPLQLRYGLRRHLWWCVHHYQRSCQQRQRRYW